MRLNQNILLNKYKAFLFTGVAILANNPISADTPLGWINSTNNSAYTTNAGKFEVSFAKLAVNETIDVLNFREDILQSNQALTGKSGDLNGNKLELHYGTTPSLSLYYRRQQQEITLDIAEIGSIDLVRKDDNLSPTLQTAAIKWTFYERNLLQFDNRRSAAAFELSTSRSQSDDFGVTIKKLRLDDIEFIFRDPQTFSVVDLQDEGWKARLVYSFELGGLGIRRAGNWQLLDGLW